MKPPRRGFVLFALLMLTLLGAGIAASMWRDVAIHHAMARAERDHLLAREAALGRLRGLEAGLIAQLHTASGPRPAPEIELLGARSPDGQQVYRLTATASGAVLQSRIAWGCAPPPCKPEATRLGYAESP